MNKINIEDSNVTYGNNSPIYINSDVKIEWGRLQNDCLDLISQLTKEEVDEYQLKTLVNHMYAKNKAGVRHFLLEHSKLLASNFICSIGSQYLINFLQNFK